MVERQSCKLKVLGSIPSGGLFKKAVFHKRLCVDVCPIAAAQDSLAERSKAVAQGAIPQGRGFEPHSCHLAAVLAAASHNNQKYTWPGSNWRPSACEADVIATRPQVPLYSTPPKSPALMSPVIFVCHMHQEICIHWVMDRRLLQSRTWCSGITSALHAEGPGFNSQCVQFFMRAIAHLSYCYAGLIESWWRARAEQGYKRN